MPEDTAETAEALRDLLWAREIAIYQARGRGDLAIYAGQITGTYLAWPPTRAEPLDAAGFRAQVAQFASTGTERLDMALTGFSADGDTAILYYRTHRTRLPNGRPADEHFEVVHVWLRREHDWRLFGGMARPADQRVAHVRPNCPPGE